LEFVLEDHSFSMPVGRIEYMHLGPMVFSEFLIATGNRQLSQYIGEYNFGDDLPLPLHDKLTELVKSYMVVGGMPESVREFINSGSYLECGISKASIMETYKDDFNKYGPKVNRQYLLTVFNAMPNIIGKKVKYVNISRTERAKDLARALRLLSLSRVCHLVYHSSCNGIPLGAEINRKIYKPIFLDVGLLLDACGLTTKDIVKATDIMLINSGQICEQFVGQHLLYSREPYREPQLYYWLREVPSSNAEIDYVITHGRRIIPIEIKAGKSGSLRSLHQFTIEKDVDLAVRVCSATPSIEKCSGKMPNGTQYKSKLITLPFYMIEQLSRLLDIVE
jgi:predicted AAA+ superfamily ATPase